MRQILTSHLQTMKVALLVALLAVSACCEERQKRQWFGGFWGQPTVAAVAQPVVHTASVQQPVVTQEVQQPVFQTQYAPAVVQNHEHIVDQPVYKHIQHTVAVPTPVIDPVVVAPRVIVPKPSSTKISVIQRAKRDAVVAAKEAVDSSKISVIQKRQIFGGFGNWGWGAAPVVATAPAAHVHTNIVNPPLVQQVVRPVVHTQVVTPIVHTHSTVVRPVVQEVHSNVYVPQPVHIKPTIVEPTVVAAEPSETKISVIQRAKRDAVVAAKEAVDSSKISVIQKRQVFGYPAFGGYFGSYGYPATYGYGYPAYGYGYAPAVVAGPHNSKISVIQRAKRTIRCRGCN